MRVLVCGDRHWTDGKVIHATLDHIHAEKRIDLVIEGGARGADRIGRRWAVDTGVNFIVYEANWYKYGRAAGPIRNTQMLVEGKPDLVVAFHNDIEKSRGTANMLKQAKKAGVKTILFP